MLFALAYAVLTLAFGFVPTNMLLRKMMGASIMPEIWRNSVVSLAERTAAATIACWIGLALFGRARGRLTGKGMLALGAAMSGALAGAVDVGLHKLWVDHIIHAAHTAPWRGVSLSLAITAGTSLVITLALITRSLKPVITSR
jgi:hypothetical protein